MRIAELDEIAHRFGDIDLALLPINGLTIRPLLNKQVVMNAVEAADLTRTLRPRLAVPIHYAFTAGPLRDRLLLKTDGRPEVFVDAAADAAPDTDVRVLEPGEPLAL
jgi:L-ascorbate metabolism protein UlaG (beta-lactamase superfamily)